MHHSEVGIDVGGIWFLKELFGQPVNGINGCSHFMAHRSNEHFFCFGKVFGFSLRLF